MAGLANGRLSTLGPRVNPGGHRVGQGRAQRGPRAGPKVEGPYPGETKDPDGRPRTWGLLGPGPYLLNLPLAKPAILPILRAFPRSLWPELNLHTDLLIFIWHTLLFFFIVVHLHVAHPH